MLPCVGHSLSKEKLFLVNKDGDFMSAVPLTVNSLIIQLAVSFSVCPCPTSLSLSFFFFLTHVQLLLGHHHYFLYILLFSYPGAAQ